MAHIELERIGIERAILEDGIGQLRTAPLSNDAIEKLRVTLRDLEQTRDQLEHALRALRYVEQHREAVRWTDAESCCRSGAHSFPH